MSLFRQGPYADLIGLPAPAEADAAANVAFDISPPGSWPVVDAGSGWLPAEMHGFLEGATDKSWVAVALNGTIVGLVQPHSSGELFSLLPDTHFVEGANRIDLYLVSGSVRSPRLKAVKVHEPE